MESVTKILETSELSNLQKSTKANSSVTSSEPIGSGDPSCPNCGGLGFVVPDVLPGHPGFGKAVVCACRKAEQEESRRNTLLTLSQIGALRNCTFSTFIVDSPGVSEKTRTSLNLAYRAANEFAVSPRGWLILQGGYGCGKTHLAAAIANFQLDRGRPVLFINTPDLLDHLRGTFNPESTVTYDDRFEEIRTASLLILDDLGTQSNSPWAQEKLYQIINYRYTERLPTVITTNLDETDFQARIRSRMFHEEEVSRIMRIEAHDFRRGMTGQDQSELSTLDLHRHLTFTTFISPRPDLDPRVNQDLVNTKAAALKYAESIRQQNVETPWFVLSGGNHGNGKTHLAAAIANHVSATGDKVLFVVVPDLLDYLRAAFDPSSKVGLDKRFDEIRKSRYLVVLDDLGTESATPFVREKLYQLFNYRYVASLPTVITTAIQIDRLDSHLASRMSDRVKCNFQELSVSSYYIPPSYQDGNWSRSKSKSPSRGGSMR